MNDDDVVVVHEPEAGRFVAEVDGHVCRLDYTMHGGHMVMTHTGVPPEVGGRGIAAQLVRAGLEHAQAEGLTVVPRCSYVAAFAKRHGEYAGLFEQA